jgi:aminoglycoside 6-adenylyltransferase
MEMIEDFFVMAIYIARYLRRGDVIAARYIQDGMQKQERLIPMLVWHMEIAHGWTLKPGLYGRRLQQVLRPDLYAALESTYTCTTLDENRLALERSIALMRTAAIEVGAALGFAYPEELHRRAGLFIEKIFNLSF